MRTQTNKIFDELIFDFDLNPDFNFEIEIPKEIQKILDDQIIENENGITLRNFGTLKNKTSIWENRSVIEDEQNHFHIDWTVKNTKETFMLAVKTLLLLAQKFSDANLMKMRFWLSFQTAELGEQQAIDNNLHDDRDEYFISDRLSFYTIRENEDLFTIDDEHNYSAILTIDI
jgi:hypothetical protein